MKKIVLLCLVLLGALSLWAEDVFILVKNPTTEGEALWQSHAVVPLEAVSCYVPTYFAKSGKAVTYTRSYNFSYSSQGSQSVMNLSGSVLYKYSIKLTRNNKLPKAKKTVTVSVGVKDLGGTGLYTDSPGLLALHRAILASSYKAGYAWVQSLAFDGKGTFKIVVGFVDKL